MLIHVVHTDFELTGGVVYADMLERTNLIALVGGGQAPKFPDRNGELKYKAVGSFNAAAANFSPAQHGHQTSSFSGAYVRPSTFEPLPPTQ